MKVKSNDKGSKMTIDKLAIMVAKGFANVATKEDFKSLEARMATKTDVEGIKNQLAGMNKRIDDFAETKVSKIMYKGLESRVQKIEAKI